jgi:hypothetical protein
VRAVPRFASSGDPPASERSQPAELDEPIALFSPWLAPLPPTIVRPPLIIVNAFDEFLPDPIRERFRNETP